MEEKEKTNMSESTGEKVKAGDSEKNEAKSINKVEPDKKSSSGKKTKRSRKSSQVNELEDKVIDLNDKFLRLYSEFDNFRKRTLKEKLELSKNAAEEVITELLPILDDFSRAIQSNEGSEDCNAIIDGIKLIHNKINGILEKRGLKPIEAKGKEFDTDFHEAISRIPAPEKDLKGKIVDDVETGYMLNDKVIRYSKVVIGQ